MSKEVWLEIKKMLLCIALMFILELLVFFILGFFDIAVLYGGLLGSLVSFLNFFFLAVTVEMSVKKGKANAQGTMGISYMVRLLFIALAVVFAIKSSYINYVSAVIPLIFPRISILILNILSKKGEAKKDERT